jgi:DNA-binding CsgD family transcriptional regulator
LISCPATRPESALDLDQRAGRGPEARPHLREALDLAMRAGIGLLLIDCLDIARHLSALAHRWEEAITLWVAHAAWLQDTGVPDLPQHVLRRQEPTWQARQALGPGRARAAEERGAAMTLATAAEFALLLVAADSRESPAAGLARLTAPERELVMLVARGRTDAQNAGQLLISIRTVRSHLDRIRDKTGCRRRADLTRLTLQTGLV